MLIMVIRLHIFFIADKVPYTPDAEGISPPLASAVTSDTGTQYS